LIYKINFVSKLKTPTSALWFMNVILLFIDHQHVVATHVAIFRMVSARIQIYL